jgi:hypothetical protein
MGRKMVIVVALVAAVASGLVGGRASAASKTFRNEASISLPGVGPALQSPITVAGVKSARKVTVTLHGLTHATPGNFAAVLASPSGKKVALISLRGGSHDVNNITLTFDDAGDGLSHDGTLPLNGGRYLPTGGAPSMNAPCEAPFEGRMKYVNVTGQLNGTWTLCMYDQFDNDMETGTLAGGWSLKFHDFVRSKTSPPSPTPTDWIVRFSVIGLAPATKDLAGSYIDTTTVFDGEIRLNKEPKRGEVSVAEAVEIGPILQSDRYEGVAGDDLVFSSFVVMHATYLHGDTPIVKFPAVVSESDYADCFKPGSTKVNVGKMILVGAPVDNFDRFVMKRFDCDQLNKTFEPGPTGVMQVEITGPEEVPEVA